MRWIWALVVACLMAAAPVRPAPSPDGREAATLEAAAQALPVVAHRREGARAPEHRLVAIAPHAVVELDPPTVYALVRERAASSAPHVRFVSSRSSRGPPVALAS